MFRNRRRLFTFTSTLVAGAFLAGCPADGGIRHFDDGMLNIQVQNAHEYEGAQLRAHLFESQDDVGELEAALGFGIYPGAVERGFAEVVVCDSQEFGEPAIYVGGEAYFVSGFLDADDDALMSPGDAEFVPDLSVTIDGNTILTLQYPDDFLPVLAEGGSVLELLVGEVRLSSGDTFSFGSTVVETPSSVMFRISNPGTETLVLEPSSPFVAGSDAANYLVTEEPSSSVHPGTTTNFELTFTPSGEHQFMAHLEIGHNATGYSPMSIYLTGDGTVPVSRVPVTGMTTSHVAGDDGDIEMGVEWPADRFMDNLNGTVTDGLTGLIWQQSASGTTRTWIGTLSYAASLDIEGFTDWRVPNVNELTSVLNAETYDNESWLEGLGFDGLQPDYYWTSTTFAFDETSAWIVDLGPASAESGAVQTGRKIGDVNPIGQTILYRVLCVRGPGTGSVTIPKTGQTVSYAAGDDGDLEIGADWPAPRFVDNGNDTATDLLTGLMWDRSPGGPTMKWETAVAGAADRSTGGFTDWRLANRLEMRSVVDYGRVNSVIWLESLVFAAIYEFHYWTSTPYPAGSDYAWITFLPQGHTLFEYKVPGSGFWKPAWYVRGGG